MWGYWKIIYQQLETYYVASFPFIIHSVIKRCENHDTLSVKFLNYSKTEAEFKNYFQVWLNVFCKLANWRLCPVTQSETEIVEINLAQAAARAGRGFKSKQKMWKSIIVIIISFLGQSVSKLDGRGSWELFRHIHHLLLLSLLLVIFNSIFMTFWRYWCHKNVIIWRQFKMSILCSVFVIFWNASSILFYAPMHPASPVLVSSQPVQSCSWSVQFFNY